VDRARALQQRLSTQRLTSSPLDSAGEVVRLLTCVQSQERDHAFFSLGVRSHSATFAAVKREYDQGAFLRVHILRPTWHFVAPEDLRWILAITSPRVIPRMAARHRQLGLDDPRVVNRALDALAELLRGGSHRTRREIGAAFAPRRGLPRAGQQLGHLLLLAELKGLICSGPMKGVHHSYALADEVVTPSSQPDPEEARMRLVHRFFAGHGPASVRDFTRWSSLTAAAAGAALSELGSSLERCEIEGEAHWFDPAAIAPRARRVPAAHLLPVYDEAVLSYRATGFPLAPAHPGAMHSDPFWAPVIAAERNVGLWKRALTKTSVRVTVRLSSALGAGPRRAVAIAARRLAEFLERELEYVEGEPAAPMRQRRSALPRAAAGRASRPSRSQA
jgi:hypothetical protein